MDATAESGNLKIGGYEAWESGWTTYAKIPIFTLKKWQAGKLHSGHRKMKIVQSQRNMVQNEHHI